jgi:Flp pilus assembly protein TadG
VRWLRRRFNSRRAQEHGYVAILVAFLVPTVFMACAAFAVDTSNWYAQQRDMQKAADAAALAGVPYLPNDMASATAKALAVAARNGYTDGVDGVSIAVGVGDRPTQLKVTITHPVRNSFGQVIGAPTTQLSRTAVADYQGPSPMGSPCSNFGNEPAAGGGTTTVSPVNSSINGAEAAYCSTNPQMWATVEGPETNKYQGDRYQTLACASNGADACASNKNTEYAPNGYFYVVKVQPAAVGQPVQIQLYDPEYAGTGTDCSSLPNSGTYGSASAVNTYVQKSNQDPRYTNSTTTSNGTSFCTGDNDPDGINHLMTTSFTLRQQTDTADPMKAAQVAGCTKQYTGVTTPTKANWPGLLKSSSGTYNDQLAQVFHNWTALCTFTPSRDGDYYLQVQTDVSTGGSSSSNTNSNPAIIYSGNTNVGNGSANTTTGSGSNSFAMRAIVGSGTDNTSVSVSGYNSMAIFANATGASSQFHLIRVLPGAAGNFISFSFFDVGDATGSGSITVVPPADATGSITSNPFPGGCAAEGGAAGAGTTYSNCKATISNSTNNGEIEKMTIPIPSDYTCNYASMGGCWYLVTVAFGSGNSVHDVTTWDAQVVGDPVRLIQ